jgi:hypothetical protein
MVEQGVEIQIIPRTLPTVRFAFRGRDTDANTDRHRSRAVLTGLDAMVEYEFNATDPLRDFNERIRRLVIEVLQRTLRHLRDISDDPMMDVYLGTMKLAAVENDDGTVQEHDSDFDLEQASPSRSGARWGECSPGSAPRRARRARAGNRPGGRRAPWSGGRSGIQSSARPRASARARRPDLIGRRTGLGTGCISGAAG